MEILFFCFWIMLGLQALAPYINSGILRNNKPFIAILIIVLFIILGPLIAISNIVNVILNFIGGDDDDFP